MTKMTEPPMGGERALDFTALFCDGEAFRPRSLDGVVDGGAVLVFYGFTYSAIAENWWKEYERRGWNEFDVPVVGVSRDGPYAQNRFIRDMGLSFELIADVNGDLTDTYGLTTQREGMAGVETARRAIFILDENRTVIERWVADDWISPPPVDEIETAVTEL